MKCYICKSSSYFLLKKDGYSLYKCSNCELVFLHPLPDKKYLSREIYSEKSGYQNKNIEDITKVKENKNQIKIFQALTKFKIKGKILDVGCSTGEFMYLAEKRGVRTSGVELNKRTADIAISNGLNVFNGFLEEAKFKNKCFSAVVLGDVIEHDRDPRSLILECERILEDGGILIISTPNLDCFWPKATFILFKLFKIPWSSVTPPYHLYQFSRNNLDLLLTSKKFKNINMVQ